MDVFLLQVVNECKITIGEFEEPSNSDYVSVMKPGNFVWIPRGTWHQLEPTVSRVTFSFGVEGDFNPADYV
jgi:mannose-6-phosphate isomerase-like protein (cupin superfamily)